MKIFAFLLHVDLMQAKQEHKKQQKKIPLPRQVHISFLFLPSPVPQKKMLHVHSCSAHTC